MARSFSANELEAKITECNQYLDMWEPLIHVMEKGESLDEDTLEHLTGMRTNISNVKAKRLLYITDLAKKKRR